MTDIQDRPLPEPSRRERKKDETRERIAQAAMALFAEKGFAAATVDEIAQRADVAKGTFFNHFPRKEAVLAYYASDELDRLDEQVESALVRHSTAREQLIDVFEQGTETWTRNPDLSRVLFLEMLKGPEDALFAVHERGHSAVRRLVDRAQSRGEMRADADPDRITDLLRGMFLSTALVWLHCPALFDLRAEVRERLLLILGGLESGSA